MPMQPLYRTVNDLTPDELKRMTAGLSLFIEVCHGGSVNRGFWATEEAWNFGEKIALVHTELSEAMEGHRHGNPPSDHIPEIPIVAEELADAMIRIGDLEGRMEEEMSTNNWGLEHVIVAKLRFNLTRPPKHGKSC